MRFPVDYIDIKGFFYDGYNINFGYYPENSYVYSIDDGKVIYAQYQSKYNNVIFIKHNNGLISMYKRLENTNVELGQKVTKGEKIGLIGSPIGSNKKYLLFGLFSENANYFNGQSDLDPFDYLYLYQNQKISNSTINRFGVKIKYHDSYLTNQDISSQQESLIENTSLIKTNYYNTQKPFIENNLSLGIFLIFIIVLLCITKFIWEVQKRSKRYV